MPRVLFVGREPLPAAAPGLAGEEVGRDRGGDRLPRPRRGRAPGGGTRASASGLRAPARPRVLDGALFYLRLRSGSARQIHDFRAGRDRRCRPVRRRRSARSAAGSRGATTPVIVEVHGDWRTFTRGYGSPARRLLSPVDRPHQRPRPAPGRHDAGRLGVHVGPDRGGARRARNGDVPDLQRPLRVRRRARCSRCPSGPSRVFVGMLEAYKNIDGLAAPGGASPRTLPEARLVIIGKGKRSSTSSTRSCATCRSRSSTTRSWLPPRSRPSSTKRRCSCCRRGRKGSAAS